MGRLVVMLSVSLDGYFEGPGHDISWHQVSDELHRQMNADVATSAGLLNGRRNWELMEEYWPTAGELPGATDVEKEFSDVWLRVPQHVFSSTLEAVGHGATLHRDIEAVPELKAATDGVLFAGGANLAGELARRGWVDEYRLHVVPVVLGAGTPLFPAGERQELRLLDQRTYPDGVVTLRYEVVR